MPKQRKTITKQREIEEFAAWLEETEREQFADNLQAARAVYALNPELVTAPEYPAEFWPDFVRSCKLNKEIPERAIRSKSTDLYEPDYRQSLLRRAKRYYEEQKREAKAKKPSGFQPDSSLTTGKLSANSDTHNVTQPGTRKAKIIPFPVNPVRPATW